MVSAGAQLKDFPSAGDESLPIVAEGISSGPSTEIGSNDSKSDSDSECNDDDDDFCSMQLSRDDTLLIFDWDDTILASTWLQQQGLRLDAPSTPTLEQQKKLDDLAAQAACTLQTARQFGKVVLITNAGRGWIERSCLQFMPSLYALVEDIEKISARATYERHGVVSPFEWKFLAFQREIMCWHENGRCAGQKSVVSFGDAAYEREAVIRVTEDLTLCYAKSVKLAERPDIDQLTQQHEIINGCLKQMVLHEGSFDLCIRC